RIDFYVNERVNLSGRRRVNLSERYRKRFSSKEFGSVFMINQVDRYVDLANIVDSVIPSGKKTSGPTVGELLLYAVINRAIAPKSKRQMASWYEKTDIQQVRPARLEALSPQNFRNHWDRIGEEGLKKISECFFKKVRALFSDDEHFMFDTTNYYTYLGSQTPSGLAKRGHNKSGKHYIDYLRQVGLALVVQRSNGLPVYYELYPGNQHDASFFKDHLEKMMDKLGESVKELTLIFDKGMNSQEVIERIDEKRGLHFITSYSPYFAQELASILLKRFKTLDCRANEQIQGKDKILFYETSAPFWGRTRKVVIIFNPKTFRKKRYDLKEKLQKVREELFELRRKHREGDCRWKKPEAVKSYYERLCESLHICKEVFELSFYKENDHPAMSFHLNRYQMESSLRRFAKTILVTDHDNWPPQEIYQAYMDRYIVEDQFRKTKNPFHVAFMPQYHWTDSKIRIHAFVCIVTLAYLSLMKQMLAKKGIFISVYQAMEEMRSLRSSIYWMRKEKRPKRILEETTIMQKAILNAFGYQVKDGRVIQL
ncbi:MAG: IS1634 family transposase, partial [Candidatus Hodarchaeota archaeon]